jgi:hypothetical protein
MSALSDYAELKVLDHLLGTATFTKPSAVYIGHAGQSLADDASGTETSGNGYARQAITFAAASSGSAASNATVNFPAATGSQGTITHFGIFDSASGGNLLCHGVFDSSKQIALGDILRINSGSITITAA